MDKQKYLETRRLFLKKVIRAAGLAFAAPAILSTVSSSDLHAQASGEPSMTT